MTGPRPAGRPAHATWDGFWHGTGFRNCRYGRRRCGRWTTGRTPGRPAERAPNLRQYITIRWAQATDRQQPLLLSRIASSHSTPPPSVKACRMSRVAPLEASVVTRPQGPLSFVSRAVAGAAEAGDDMPS